jgi:hypothetical protein
MISLRGRVCARLSITPSLRTCYGSFLNTTLHLALRVTPQRRDLFDEGRGRGARETVE